MMYYVVKITLEDNDNNTQVIRPHSDYKSALKDFYKVFGETLEYDSVRVCSMMLIDTYNNVVEQARYARPESGLTE